MTPPQLLYALRRAADAGDDKAADFLPTFERWFALQSRYERVVAEGLERIRVESC